MISNKCIPISFSHIGSPVILHFSMTYNNPGISLQLTYKLLLISLEYQNKIFIFICFLLTCFHYVVLMFEIYKCKGISTLPSVYAIGNEIVTF